MWGHHACNGLASHPLMANRGSVSIGWEVAGPHNHLGCRRRGGGMAARVRGQRLRQEQWGM